MLVKNYRPAGVGMFPAEPGTYLLHAYFEGDQPELVKANVIGWQVTNGRNLDPLVIDPRAAEITPAFLNAAADATPVVVNLASEEYFKSVDRKALKPRVVTCVFEEFKAGKYKVISFMAKRARGLMVRHAVSQRAVSVEQLKRFDAEGYRYIAEVSEPDRLVFRRDLAR